MYSKNYKIYSENMHKTVRTIKKGKLYKASVKGIVVSKENGIDKTLNSTDQKQHGRK